MERLLMMAVTLGIMAFSCSKEDSDCAKINSCSVANPVQDLPWLKARVTGYEQNLYDISQYYFITQAEYNGETVFFEGNCCPMCNTAPPQVLNCKGESLFTMGQDVSKDNQIKNRKIVWKGPQFACPL